MVKTIITLGKDNSNTRERDFTKRAHKKYNIDDIDHELKDISKHAGVYILSPYSNLDRSKRTVYKIGMSLQLKTRCDNYLTYFPMVHFHSFVVGFKDSEYKKFQKNNPEVTLDDLDDDKVKKLKLFRTVAEIEKKIIDKIFEKDKKSRKLQFAQRTVHSEWIYTKSSVIDEVCLEICDEYKLDHKGYVDEYNDTILKYYNDNLPDTIFVGKILFT